MRQCNLARRKLLGFVSGFTLRPVTEEKAKLSFPELLFICNQRCRAKKQVNLVLGLSVPTKEVTERNNLSELSTL